MWGHGVAVMVCAGCSRQGWQIAVTMVAVLKSFVALYQHCSASWVCVTWTAAPAMYCSH